MERFIPGILLVILLFVSSFAQAENRDSHCPLAPEYETLANTISIKKSIQMSSHQPHVANHIRRKMQDNHNAAMRDIRKRASLNRKLVRLN